MKASGKTSYWLRSGFYTLSERLSILIFGLGGAMLLFRALSPADFGYWVTFLTIVAVLEVGRIGLLQNALVKYLATACDEDYADILSASLVLNVLLTGAIVGILWIGAPLICDWMNAPRLVPLLKIYCVTTVLLIPYFQFNFVQQANLDFRGIFWSGFAKQGLMFAFIAGLFMFSKQIELLQLARFQWVTAILGSLVSFLFARKYLKFSARISWDWVRLLFHFGKYVLGTNLSTMLYKSIDKMMLMAIPTAGAAAVALYEAAIKVTNFTDVPTFSVANILFPQSARRMEEGPAAVKKLYEKAVGAILTVMVPCILGVWAFADLIIVILAGDQYANAANLLRVTILYGLFMPFAIQFGTVLDSIGRPKINFYMTLFSMGLNVVFNFIFIVRFGVYGAAFGTLLTYAVTFILMQIILYKILKIKAWRAFGFMMNFYSEGWMKLRQFRMKKNLIQESLPPLPADPVPPVAPPEDAP